MKDNMFKADQTGRSGDSAFEFMDTMGDSHRGSWGKSSDCADALKKPETHHKPAAHKATAHKAAPKKKSGDCADALKKPAAHKATAHKTTAHKSATHKPATSKTKKAAPKKSTDGDYVIIGEIITVEEY
jgi:hypothetical protein